MYIKAHILDTVFYAIILTASLHSCELIDYHPYDVRISGESDINAKNIMRIEDKCKDKEKIKVAAIGDTHKWYDELKLLIKDINSRIDIDFVIHDGDMSEFGYTQEFIWTRDYLQDLNIPYVSLIGNHDCLGTGKEAFEAIFGPTDFSFIAGNIKFVCLNTNALEYDYSQPIPDFEFIIDESTSRTDEFSHSVACMHARPGDDVFNNNVSTVFHHYLKMIPGLMCCINGHGHSLKNDDIFGDGIIYHQTTSLDDRAYLLFTFNNDGTYECEEIHF